MDDYWNAIFAVLVIHFHEVRAGIERKAEGRQRILWRNGTIAPMADNERLFAFY